MRQIYTHITKMLLLSLTVLSLTSCLDDDVDQAYDMNGIWQGTIQGNYYADRFHSNDYDTEIQFVQTGTFNAGGRGVEIDYPRDPRQPYYEVEFDWEVRNGKIYLDYYDGYRVIIRDYELYTVGNGMRFRGYFDDYDTGQPLASFELVKVSDRTDRAKAQRPGVFTLDEDTATESTDEAKETIE